MMIINLYLAIDKHNNQSQDYKEQIRCKIRGRQNSAQEELTFWDIVEW